MTMQRFTSLFQSWHDYFLTKRLPSSKELAYLQAAPSPLLLSKPALTSGDTTTSPFTKMPQATNQSVSANDTNATTLFPVSETVSTVVQSSFPTVMYVTNEAPLLAVAHKSFDSRIKNLRYGDAVTVTAFQGNYARIQKGNDIGWIEKDSLQPRKENVWPIFKVGKWYAADDEMTVRTRELIADEFFAGGATLPLQSVEYIAVELKRDNRQISWEQKTNRVPGSWHQLLRGQFGIHIVVYPVTDSVMEWTDEAGVGHVAYVREVRPDKTLRIEGIGILEIDRFESVVLPESLWREWRPVFIEVG